MSIELKATTGTTSGSQIQAYLGGNQTLLVLSGIAIPNWEVNDDGHLYFMDIHVHLGVYAYRLLQSSVVTALCRLENDNSAFTSALNNATVLRKPDTGELLLSTQNALSGSRTALNRFSYRLPTGFRFPNFDPRTAELIVYQHSSIASLNLLQASRHELFTVAVDQVDAGSFDDQGVWTLKLNLADQLGTGGDWLNWDASAVQFGYFSVSSWILCYLPPASDPSPRPAH